MNWKSVNRMVENIEADKVASAVQRALKDPETREALAQTYAQGRTVYEQLTKKGPKDGFGRLARDSKRQAEVGALVRSVTATIDAQTKPRKRRGRKLLAILIGVGGITAVVLHRRRSGADSAAVAGGDESYQPAVNGSGQPETISTPV